MYKSKLAEAPQRQPPVEEPPAEPTVDPVADRIEFGYNVLLPPSLSICICVYVDMYLYMRAVQCSAINAEHLRTVQ
jgi:hypothetical protein